MCRTVIAKRRRESKWRVYDSEAMGNGPLETKADAKEGPFVFDMLDRKSVV